jgi:tetratricopeptide (TPR) repeat protein
MKKLLFITALTAIFACNNAQKSFNYNQLYLNSMAIKDYQTAIVALQSLLLTDSTNTAYLDSLPELYAAVKNFAASEYYTDKALLKDPQSEKFLQIKALCAQNNGDFEVELDVYNKLYASTNKLSYLYQITAYQFGSGLTESAISNLGKLESLMANSTDSVDFLISETEKQKVPLKAAVYNMKAYMEAQKRDLAGAKRYFEMALKEFPDFVTARQNYEQLTKGARQQ